MNFKLKDFVEGLSDTDINEANQVDVLKAEYKRLSAIEITAMEDGDMKMVQYLADRQKVILKQLNKLVKKQEKEAVAAGYGESLDEAQSFDLGDIVSHDGKTFLIFGITKSGDKAEIVQVDKKGEIVKGGDELYNVPTKGFKMIKANEADGSMGDMGTPPSDHNPLLKYKLKKKAKDQVEDADEACKKKKKHEDDVDYEIDEEDVEEVKANRDAKDKKMAKKKAVAKAKAKCKGNMTPKLVSSGASVRYKCTPKDKEKARKASKTMKKVAKTAAGKKARKTAQKTKDYRGS